VLSEGFSNDFEIFKNPQNVKKIEEDLKHEDWENIVLQCGYDKIFIGSANNLSQYEGKSISQIAKELNSTELEAMLKVLVDSMAQATIIYYIVSEDDLRLLMQSPYCCIGTDAYARDYSGATTGGKPHPRNFGAIPRFIKKYVLNEKLMSIEEGIYKITGFPAKVFKIPNRGLIQENKVADITVINPLTIGETGTYLNPATKPNGIEYVIIEGKVAVDKGNFNDIRAGKMLKLGI
jgi:N-acyl-D-amino-acid deacylase